MSEEIELEVIVSPKLGEEVMWEESPGVWKHARLGVPTVYGGLKAGEICYMPIPFYRYTRAAFARVTGKSLDRMEHRPLWCNIRF